MDIERTDKIKQFYIKLMNREMFALSFVKPIDPMNIKPKAMVCTTADTRFLWDYFRCALSTEPQSSSVMGTGRLTQWLLFDENTGGILGLWANGDAPLPWKPFDAWLGAKIGGTNSEIPTAAHVTYMCRCLPLYEFGDLTGGKLITLLATSRECMRTLELRYSYKFAALMVKTLHGKSSQYNRMHAQGLEFVGEHEGRGLYVQELRKKGLRFLKGEVTQMGKTKCPTFEDQFKFWQERWLSVRLKGSTEEIPIINDYSLSSKFTKLFRERD